ncbi:MAG: FecR domain-containing protein [Leptolyngbya sp. SIOISBB]|nr:FecR domain-containing protein [Leptolyngbya sp. SIOISBB]
MALVTPLWAQNSIDVSGDRSLRVQNFSGNVQYFSAGTSYPAQIGDQLTTVGEGVRTGSGSSCTLAVDVGVGTITLRENTELLIRELGFAEDNGRITRLSVPQGNVILNLRRFTHRGSELEIETPSGVSGVRGTEFGIIVHPEDQRTSIATLTGAVFAEAVGTTVDVPDGFQTLMRVGEPPLEPQPIPAEPVFEYQIEEAMRDYVRYLVLIGRIDPINQVYVADELQDVTKTGEFRYESLAYRGATVQVNIVTPLGDVTTYDISLL